MKVIALVLFLFGALEAGSTTVTANPLLGKWKIGKPFYNLPEIPIGIDAKQERSLVGATLDIQDTSVIACGKRIQYSSLDATAYSADEFTENFKVSPHQIGLTAPLTMYSMNSQDLMTICGSSEGFMVISDGKNSVLEVANDYFHLTKLNATSK